MARARKKNGRASTAAKTSKEQLFKAHPQDARQVRRAYEESVKHPKSGIILTPEQLKHWAETGEWPELSD